MRLIKDFRLILLAMKHKQNFPPRLAARNRQQDIIIGVVWYTASEWAKTKASAADPDRFEEKYEEWLQVAEKAFDEFRASSLNVRRSLIKSENLLAWCIAKGKQNTAASRSEYVASLEYAAENTDA